MKPISPHAKTLLALLNNARELCCIHHEYPLAKDVIKAAKNIAKKLGFDIDDEIFEHILDSIGNKNPSVMEEEFDKFAKLISILDKKLDNEPLAGDKKYGEPRK